MRTYKLFLVCLLVVSIIGCARNEPLPSGNEQQEKQSYGFQGLPSDRDINKHKTYVDEEVHAYAEEARNYLHEVTDILHDQDYFFLQKEGKMTRPCQQ